MRRTTGEWCPWRRETSTGGICPLPGAARRESFPTVASSRAEAWTAAADSPPRCGKPPRACRALSRFTPCVDRFVPVGPAIRVPPGSPTWDLHQTDADVDSSEDVDGSIDFTITAAHHGLQTESGPRRKRPRAAVTRYHSGITNLANPPGPGGPDLRFRARAGVVGRPWTVSTTCAKQDRQPRGGGCGHCNRAAAPRSASVKIRTSPGRRSRQRPHSCHIRGSASCLRCTTSRRKISSSRTRRRSSGF